MAALPKIGKFLFALPMGVFGILHFMMADMMAGMVPVPGGVVWVYFTGIALIAAAVGIITGKHAVLAAQGLVLFLLLTALTVHLPAVMGGDQSSLGLVLRDLALAGGAMVLSGALASESGSTAV